MSSAVEEVGSGGGPVHLTGCGHCLSSLFFESQRQKEDKHFLFPAISRQGANLKREQALTLTHSTLLLFVLFMSQGSYYVAQVSWNL